MPADRPNLTGRLWYDCVFWSSFTFFTFGFSLRRGGLEERAATRARCWSSSNHQSMFDPVLVGLSSRRYLSYLARKNLFEQPVLAPLIRSLNAIPIDRGMGKDGIQAVLDALGQGQAVLVFPEGERTHNGEVQPLKPGVSLLIKRVKCPIVPVGIAGAFAAWRRHMTVAAAVAAASCRRRPSTIAVAVGEPIDPARYKGMDRDGDDGRSAPRTGEAARRRRAAAAEAATRSLTRAAPDYPRPGSVATGERTPSPAVPRSSGDLSPQERGEVLWPVHLRSRNGADRRQHLAPLLRGEVALDVPSRRVRGLRSARRGQGLPNSDVRHSGVGR